MWYIDNSKIQGQGVFIKETIPANHFIDVVIENAIMITFFGSKINHSWNPNCKLYQYKDYHWLVSQKPILAGEELTINYYYTPAFIKKPNDNWR